jgi:hypothetical protein
MNPRLKQHQAGAGVTGSTALEPAEQLLLRLKTDQAARPSGDNRGRAGHN